MAIKRNVLNKQITTTAADTSYAPSLLNGTITSCTVCNSSTTTAYTVTVYAVPVSGTAGTTNIVINARTVLASETLLLWELIGMAINNNQKLQFISSVTSVLNLTLTSNEVGL